MIRRPPRSTLDRSSAASDVYKRQALVCALFLWHLRSALVSIVALPLGILVAFLVMRWQGINANIMSLGGIAIAIGAMVDGAVVMTENAHRKIEAWQRERPGDTLAGEERWKVITDCLLYTSPSPRDRTRSRMPSSA